MRTPVALVLAAVALVAGLVIGGLGPRQEARRLREALDAAPEVADCPTDRAEISPQIAGVFRGRPLDHRLPVGAPDEQGRTGAPDEPVAATGSPGAEGGEGDEVAAAIEDPEEAIRLAKQAMELRRAQARQALIEAGATPAQLAAVDRAMAEMNDRLTALTEEFVGTIEAGEQPDRREMMLFAADTLDALITSEDALYSTFDAETRAALDETALDPFSYVDGRVVEQLATLRER